MDIQKMHVTFRVLGQQMGMQLIRTILAESIDTVINEVINEEIRTTVHENSRTVYQDRISIQDNSISPINFIRTLYKTEPVSIEETTFNGEHYEVELDINKVMYYTSFRLKYEASKSYKCRFIEGDKLDDTLADYCNTASFEYPLLSMFASENKEVVQLYNNSSKKPSQLVVRYIELPNTVKWSANLEECVNCNLPEYTHNKIVELAVVKYFNSIKATS